MKTKLEPEEKEMRKVLKKIGLDKESSERIARLLRGKPTASEKKKWNRLEIMDGDKICASPDEMNDLAIVVCLWDLCWKGMLQKVG